MEDVRLLWMPEQDSGGLCLANVVSHYAKVGFLYA